MDEINSVINELDIEIRNTKKKLVDLLAANLDTLRIESDLLTLSYNHINKKEWDEYMMQLKLLIGDKERLTYALELMKIREAEYGCENTSACNRRELGKMM